MISYTDEGVLWMLHCVDNLGVEKRENSQVTIRDDKIVISNYDEGSWQVWCGILGDKTYSIKPVFPWLYHCLRDMKLDRFPIRWYRYQRLYSTFEQREWLAKKLNMEFFKIVESLWTHQLVNEFALDKLFQPLCDHPYQRNNAHIWYIEKM